MQKRGMWCMIRARLKRLAYANIAQRPSSCMTNSVPGRLIRWIEVLEPSAFGR
jgi:hypothetical protein